MTIRSIYNDQNEILQSIQTLHCPEGFECDLTFGNGNFWKKLPRPQYCFDLDPQQSDIIEASSEKVPLEDHTLNNIVFDPPFLTYIRDKRDGNGNMVMGKRFSGYWTYKELTLHYKNTLSEAKRLLKKHGKLIFKCQDIVHNHRLHCTHANIINWADQAGLRLLDLFILMATHRMPSPNRQGKQKHSRIYHSYFLVFESISNNTLINF